MKNFEEGNMSTLDVGAWRSGTAENPRTHGIRVRLGDRDTFGRDWKSIEVEVAGGWHRFNLTEGFWKGCPEFRDNNQRVLRQWIQQFSWIKGKPPRFGLAAVGPRRFRLLSADHSI